MSLIEVAAADEEHSHTHSARCLNENPFCEMIRVVRFLLPNRLDAALILAMALMLGGCRSAPPPVTALETRRRPPRPTVRPELVVVDSDGDGVPDKRDQCPDAAEDRDDFEDRDGCPDPDNDKDGIPDARDKCPNQAEVYNGCHPHDGCPCRCPPRPVTLQKLIIPEKVYFTAGSSNVRRISHKLLDSVAELLKQRPGILRVEVQGHADANERAGRGRNVSLRRARAVRRYLMRRGVAAKRLVVRGYGSRRPVKRGRSHEARSHNRRVQFLILKRRGSKRRRSPGARLRARPGC